MNMLIGMLGYEDYEIIDKINELLFFNNIDLCVNDNDNDSLIYKVKNISMVNSINLEVCIINDKKIVGINSFYISSLENSVEKFNIRNFINLMKENRKILSKIFEKEPKFYILNSNIS